MTTAKTSRFSAGWWAAVAATGLAVLGVATVGVNHDPAPVAQDQPVQTETSGDPGAPVEAEAGVAPDPATAAASAAGVSQYSGLSPQYAPWAPGTTFQLTSTYPEAGVPFNATECTVALSFDGGNGRVYAVTASHCGSVGDLIWPSNGTTIADYTEELGRVIYSGLEEPAAAEEDRRLDIAIIEIYQPDLPMAVGGTPPPTTILADYPLDREGEVCKIGGTTGVTCGVTGDRDERYIMIDPDTAGQVRTSGDTAYLCAQRGDSGGPVTATIGGQELVIGLVSGTRSDAEGERPAESLAACPGDGVASAAGAVAYATAAQIRQVIEEVVPDARLNQVALDPAG